MNQVGDRVRQLNDYSVAAGKSILYVMSRDQRVHDNHALLAAQDMALQQGLPLAVVFCLYPGSGYRSHEHYDFMLSGLHSVEKELQLYDIPLIVVVGRALEVLPTVIERFEAAAVYFDFSPLKGPRFVAQSIANQVQAPVFVVDAHNIIPAWVVSDKQEFAARTIRPKIHKVLPKYLQDPPVLKKNTANWPGTYMKLPEVLALYPDLLSNIPSNGITYDFPDPKVALDDFLAKYVSYDEDRNDPTKDAQSNLSPYLHFGQLSSLRIALQLTARGVNPQESAFLEEIIVRKELSDNFCLYNTSYDSFDGAPAWARKSLLMHADDEREFTYSLEQLEHAQTHDNAWNAAQMQLRRTGKIHGYMRMYWAKKVLEWSPAEARKEQLRSDHPFKVKLQVQLSGLSGAAWAIAVLIYLNDFYSIDGGDPNGYVGILWSVAGVHDRPWGSRPVFGAIRYMNDKGLARKFSIKEYQNSWL